MKKAEKILGLIAFIGLILKLILIPGGGILITLSLLTLAFLYYFSFAFLNDIPLKNIFKKESYNGISPLKMIGTVGIGIALAQCSLGLLYKIQNYEGYTTLLLFGTFFLFIILIVSSIQYKKNKSPFYKKIFNRIIIVGGFALLFLLTPRMVLFEIFYRNFPEYVQAVRNLNEDPGNEEL